MQRPNKRVPLLRQAADPNRIGFGRGTGTERDRHPEATVGDLRAKASRGTRPVPHASGKSCRNTGPCLRHRGIAGLTVQPNVRDGQDILTTSRLATSK